MLVSSANSTTEAFGGPKCCIKKGRSFIYTTVLEDVDEPSGVSPRMIRDIFMNVERIKVFKRPNPLI
jgi:hypothetical protein